MIPGTTYIGLRGYRYVVSEPWVMKQTYTVKNTGTDTLDDVSFFMYFFGSPYGTYPTNYRPSHVDYTAGIIDPMGYTFDIVLYGEGDPRWAYAAFSANIPPTSHDVGHGGGYPDPPYYWPSPCRPSAISTDVLRHVETDDMRGWASYDAPNGTDPNAVAGAFKWYIGSLAPGASWSITILQSLAPHDAPIHIAIIPVEIDIKPGSYPNAINPASKGVIPVAILTTSTFNASSVNPITVKFGKTGTEASAIQWAFEDVDGDGDMDLIMHFSTQQTGITKGDTEAIVTGETFEGIRIQGKDSIVTVPN
jgi:hypothetical protein